MSRILLKGALVHRRSFPRNLLGFPQQFAHLYSWVERGTVRVRCLAQERNTVSPARAPITRLTNSTFVIPLLFQCVSTHVTFPVLIKHRLCAQYLKVKVSTFFRELSRVIFSYKPPFSWTKPENSRETKKEKHQQPIVRYNGLSQGWRRLTRIAIDDGRIYEKRG